MVDARKFLLNYTLLVAGDLGSRFISFWALVRIARVLGSDLFGNLSFAAAFTAYFALLVRQGLDTYGIQQVARDPSSVLAYARRIMGLRLAGAALAVLALLAILWQWDRPEELKMLVLLHSLMFFSLAPSLAWVFQAREQMKYVAASHILSQTVFALLTLVLLSRPSQVLWVPVFQFSGEMLGTVYLLLVFWRSAALPLPLFDWPSWKEILRDSLPMGLSHVFGVLLFNFDMLMLGFLKPASDVGAYSAAYRFINFFSAFVTLYAVNLLPMVSRCRGNPANLRRISDRSQHYAQLLALPLAIGGALVARPLITLVFGAPYAAGATALQLLFWIVPLMSSRAIFRNALISHGFQRKVLYCMCLAALLNVGLNLILIPRYSFVGAAAATVVAEALLASLLARGAARSIAHLPVLKHTWRPLAAALPMVAFLLWFPAAGIYFRIGAGALVYFGAAWLIGAFRIREVLQLFHPAKPLAADTGRSGE